MHGCEVRIFVQKSGEDRGDVGERSRFDKMAAGSSYGRDLVGEDAGCFSGG